MRRKLPFKTKVSILAILFAGLFPCSIVSAQTRPPTPLPPNDPATAEKSSSSDDKAGLAPMEEEMRVRRAIKLAEKEYKENVNRARELAELGAQLEEAAKEGRSFGRDESKKLERVEKLARKIRTEAGGSDEDTLLNNPPGKLESALARLAEVSESLYKSVEKTPRQVISTAVIEKANVVLQLTRLVRNLF